MIEIIIRVDIFNFYQFLLIVKFLFGTSTFT